MVCTEEVEIHPTSDLTPYVEMQNWDERDLPKLAIVTSKIHEHGSSAGIGLDEAPIGPSARPIDWIGPTQARQMDSTILRFPSLASRRRPEVDRRRL